MTIVIERIAAPTPAAAALLAELDAVLGAAYDLEQRLSRDELFQPHIRFFIAFVDGQAAGCGGVALFQEFAEVKRMYSRPALRRRGVAKALLARLQAEALAAWHSLLRLETGVHQAAAIGLYEGLPLHRVAASIFYEKRLNLGN